MDKKALVQKYRPLVDLACKAHNLRNVFRIKGRGHGNTIETSCALLKRVNIHFGGRGNRVIIEDFARLTDVNLYIYGDNNTVRIGPWSYIAKLTVCTENGGNEISIGRHALIIGPNELAAIEGTKITVGDDAMISSEVHFRTGDSHSVLDLERRRINASRDITLGDHVWIGTRATVLKGTVIPDDCIVGACALMSGKFEEPHCVITGVPAKITKRGVTWCRKRIGPGEVAPENLT